MMPAAAPSAPLGGGTTNTITNLYGTTIRQTVQSGPGGGTPSFLPATSASLSLTSQTLSAGANTLVVSAANGWASSGQVDTIGTATANLTWSGLTASTTNYLYVTVASGALTAGSTTLPPIYQYGGTISTAAGQYTFDIAQMKMFVGNGSTAAQVNVVFVGEAVTGASSVTSTVAYAYNGRYQSGQVAFAGISTLNSVNHNIGVIPTKYRVVIVFTTAVAGFSVGDQASFENLTGSGSGNATITGVSKYTIFCNTTSSGTYINSKTSSTLNNIGGDFALMFYADRGW